MVDTVASQTMAAPAAAVMRLPLINLEEQVYQGKGIMVVMQVDAGITAEAAGAAAQVAAVVLVLLACTTLAAETAAQGALGLMA